MPTLIACLSTGKGTWGHVAQLLKEQWDKIYLITNEYGKENFTKPDNAEFIVINTSQGLRELRDQLIDKLKSKIKSNIALNIISGTGKEHTALISALLKLGTPIKLIAITKDGLQEI